MENIDFFIANSEKKKLTGKDVVKIAGGNTKVVAYHELVNYNSVEELLEEFGSVVLLFETVYNVGHYTCLYYHKDVLHFFDPYGMKPDQELKYATYDKKAYLSMLLNKYTKPVFYNEHRFQEWSTHINTCGRWVGTRLKTKDIFSHKDFRRLFSNNLRNSPDWYVSILTFLDTL